MNYHTTILICNKKKKLLSIERKYLLGLHVSPNVEDGSPIYCIRFKPTKRDMHKSIRGLQVQPFDCILFGKSSLTNSYTRWNEYNFLPKLHKYRPICVPFQIATTFGHCTLNSNWRGPLHYAKSTSNHPSVKLKRLWISPICNEPKH